MNRWLLKIMVLGLASASQAEVFIEFSGKMWGHEEGAPEAWRWCIEDLYAWEWFEDCDFTATDSNAGFLQGQDLSKLKLKTGMDGLAAAILTGFRKTGALSDHRLYTGGEFEIAFDGHTLVEGTSDTEVDVDYVANSTIGSINGQISSLFEIEGLAISGADFAAAFNSEHDNNQWKATIVSMSPVQGYEYDTVIRLEAQDVERHAEAVAPQVDIPVLLLDAQVGFKFDAILEPGGGHVSAVRKISLPLGTLPAAVDAQSVTQYWSIGSSMVEFETELSLPYDTNAVEDVASLCVYRRVDASSAWQEMPIAAVSNGFVTVTNVTAFSDWIVALELNDDPVLPDDLPADVSQADRQMYLNWVEDHKAAWGMSDFSAVPASDFLAAWLLGQKPTVGYAAGVSLKVTAFEPVAQQPCETNGFPVAWRNGGETPPEVVRLKVELSSGGVNWDGAVNGNLVIQSAPAVTGAWQTAVGQTNAETRISFVNGVADLAFNRPANAAFYRPALAREGRAGVTGRMLPWGATVTNVWLTCAVDDVVTNGLHSSLAFDAAGNLGICYYDQFAKDLKYASYVGRELTVQRVDTAGDVGQYCDLAFTAAGLPAISYYDATQTDLKYAVYDGAQWAIQSVETSDTVGKYTSLAFGPDGHPAISYQAGSSSSGKLKYAWFNGVLWTSQIVDGSSYAGYHTSLAFAPSGRPAIAFWENDNYYVKYAAHDGASWPQSADIEKTYSRYAENLSMAFAPNGKPAIAHVDDQGKNLLYCARGTYSWNTPATVEAQGTYAFNGYVCLAFAPDGQPAISYYHDQQGDGCLKYAKHNGSQWVVTVIDAAGDVGLYTSLAFSPQGRPAISYFDKTNGKLKIAQYVELVRVVE